MMTLKEYLEVSLQTNATLENEFIKELYDIALIDHFQIEDDPRLYALPKVYCLFEGDGLVKECFEIAHVIAYNIDKRFKENPKDFSLVFGKEFFEKHHIEVHFENIFVNVNCLKESYKENKGYADYDARGLSISLDVYIPKDNYIHNKSCIDLIAHELRHYVQDYNFHRYHKSTILDYKKKLNKKFPKDEQDIIQRYLNKTEFEAYLSQLDSEIGSAKFIDLKKACIWLDKYSHTWKLYKDLKEYVMTYGSKKLQNQFRKTWRKFINHTSHILNNHLIETDLTEHVRESRYDLFAILEYQKRNFDLDFEN